MREFEVFGNPSISKSIYNKSHLDVEGNIDNHPVDQIPLVDLFDERAVLDSIRNFGVEVGHSDKFYKLVAKYLKPDARIAPDRVSFLSSEMPRSEEFLDITEDKGVFAYDSPFAFILQYEPEGGYSMPGYEHKYYPNVLYASVMAFSCGFHLGSYLERGSFENIPAAEYKYPVVIQIQGPFKSESDSTYPRDPKAYGIARDMLEQVNWESLSLAIVHEWSAQNNIPEISVLPAKYNHWIKGLSGQHPTVLRFNMRYNMTAKNYGFTKRENGLYTLDVANRPSPFELL